MVILVLVVPNIQSLVDLLSQLLVASHREQTSLHLRAAAFSPHSGLEWGWSER